MQRSQAYSPWTDFHDGHMIGTIRLDHFKERLASEAVWGMVIYGLHRDYMGRMEKKMETSI